MRNFAVLTLFWMCVLASPAQTKTDKHISFNGKQSVNLDIQIADSIDIETWNKNEVWIAASVNINENKDNNAYQISFDESGNEVAVKGNFKKDYFKDKEKNCCNETEIYWKVFIPENIPLNVETINANTTITGKTGVLKIKTISGFIDLSVPESKNADVKFSTITGTVYTNHSLDVHRQSKSLPEKFSHKLNNGGDLISLETISGDIFFRKAD